MARDDDKTGRNLALVGGGAAFVWLLLHGGGGFGFGRGGGGLGKASAAGKGPAPTPVKVRVAADGISVDGQPTDIDGAAALVKSRGAADVRITGAARQGTADDLLAALRATGATISVWGGYDHA